MCSLWHHRLSQLCFVPTYVTQDKTVIYICPAAFEERFQLCDFGFSVELVGNVVYISLWQETSFLF